MELVKMDVAANRHESAEDIAALATAHMLTCPHRKRQVGRGARGQWDTPLRLPLAHKGWVSRAWSYSSLKHLREKQKGHWGFFVKKYHSDHQCDLSAMLKLQRRHLAREEFR